MLREELASKNSEISKYQKAYSSLMEDWNSDIDEAKQNEKQLSSTFSSSNSNNWTKDSHDTRLQKVDDLLMRNTLEIDQNNNQLGGEYFLKERSRDSVYRENNRPPETSFMERYRHKYGINDDQPRIDNTPNSRVNLGSNIDDRYLYKPQTERSYKDDRGYTGYREAGYKNTTLTQDRGYELNSPIDNRREYQNSMSNNSQPGFYSRRVQSKNWSLYHQ